MGNNSSQTQILTKPIESPPSPKNISKTKTIKQKIIQQPKIEVQLKVAPKEFHIQYHLTQRQQKEIAEMKDKIKQQLALRFMSKIHKKQMRLIFSSTQMQDSKDKLMVSSSFHEKSLQKLERSCKMDLQIYVQIFQMRLKGIITHKLNQEAQDNEQTLQKLNRIKTELNDLFRQAMATLLGQIQGKTSIWHSLSLTKTRLTSNIINFCHEQGVDSSIFDFLPKKNKP